MNIHSIFKRVSFKGNSRPYAVCETGGAEEEQEM